MAAFVYIMASQRDGTIYIGATTDLVKRGQEHRDGVVEGFTKKYGCKLLVWFVIHETMFSARSREKQMKEWRRSWKLEVIGALNPTWADLSQSLYP